jgi:type II secretory pathway pseudopilin PulG
MESIIKSKQGLTLGEVLVSAAILSIVIVGIIGLFVNCNIMANEIREQSIVTNALNERMEDIRGMDYTTLLGIGTTFTPDGFSQLNANANPTGSLTLDNPFSDDDIRRVTLTVNWTTQRGRSLNKSLVTLVTNSGINKQ